MEENESEMTEERRELRRKIKDWGLSHTTLEEVFMRVRRLEKLRFVMYLDRERAKSLRKILKIQ